MSQDETRPKRQRGGRTAFTGTPLPSKIPVSTSGKGKLGDPAAPAIGLLRTDEEWVSRIRYYKAVARSIGVPNLFLSDAAQDIALRVWRAGEETSAIVRHAAVDAARRYGYYNRDTRRDSRPLTAAGKAPQCVELEAEARIELAGVLGVLRGFTARQRGAVVRAVRGEHADSTALYQARQKLRGLPGECDRMRWRLAGVSLNA